MRNRFSLPPHLSLGILKDAKEHAQGTPHRRRASASSELTCFLLRQA